MSPIFRKSSNEEAGNYRPVSVFAVLEALLNDVTVEQLQWYNLIRDLNMDLDLSKGDHVRRTCWFS